MGVAAANVLDRMAASVGALTLMGIDPGMLSKTDPLSYVLTPCDPVDKEAVMGFHWVVYTERIEGCWRAPTTTRLADREQRITNTFVRDGLNAFSPWRRP